MNLTIISSNMEVLLTLPDNDLHLNPRQLDLYTSKNFSLNSKFLITRLSHHFSRSADYKLLTNHSNKDAARIRKRAQKTELRPATDSE